MTKRKRNRKSPGAGKGSKADRAGATPPPPPDRVETTPKRDPAKTPKPPRQAGATPPASTAARRTVLNVVVGLAVAGVLLTGYLTLNKWLGASPLYCAEDSSCDLVQGSRWSTLLGLPLSLWGLFTYALIGALAWRARRRPAAWRQALFVACVGVGISLYLTAISVLVLEATCAYCLASTALICTVCGALAAARPANLPGFRWTTWLPGTTVTAALVVGGLHMHYSGLFDPAAGPEKPFLKALAIHLTETGAKFYGAYWCSNCIEQKQLFEASADRLPYVECTPGGRNGPRSAACTTRNINGYPTWIIGETRITGVIQPADLARHSKLAWEEPRP